MSWDPAQYLKFGNQRLRPALDLLAQIPLESPATVVDLGCGAGNVTRFIAERWPGAKITGVDNSAAMLEKARAALPQVAWEESGIADWQPTEPVDLIYTNAALHWLPNHPALFARLMGFLKPGGILAVQMPRNFAAPSHTSIDAGLDALNLPAAVRASIDANKLNNPVAEPEQYYDWIKPLAASIDMWETLYSHVLNGENAVAEWVKGTALIPVLNGLQAAEDAGQIGRGLRDQFWTDYCTRTNTAYPRRADNTTVFPFRRLFMIATRQV